MANGAPLLPNFVWVVGDSEKGPASIPVPCSYRHLTENAQVANLSAIRLVSTNYEGTPMARSSVRRIRRRNADPQSLTDQTELCSLQLHFQPPSTCHWDTTSMAARSWASCPQPNSFGLISTGTSGSTPEPSR